MSVTSNILSYYSVEEFIPLLQSKTLLNNDTAHTRYDQPSIAKISDSLYLVAVTRYLSSNGDFDPAEIVIYSTANFESLTYITSLSIPASTIGIYQPNLYKTLTGDIILICQNKEQTSPYRARILKYTSTDNGMTWSSFTVLRDVAEYFSMASDRIFKTPTGRLLLPFSVSNELDIEECYGYTMISDDDGATWTASSFIINSPDTYCAEQGFYQKTPSVITCYFRNVSNVLYACDSSDNGDTFGSVYSLTDVFPTSSQSTVCKLISGKFMCFYNPTTGRKNLNMMKSNDGEIFTNNLVIKGSEVESFIEPTGIEIGGYLYLLISTGISNYRLEVLKINLSEYF